MKFPFEDAPNMATITCCHVIDSEKPIFKESHDADDGMWQFLCGEVHELEDGKIVSLYKIFDMDNTVGALYKMPCGYCAERAAVTEGWIVRKHEG